jgi:hypothetical protein
MPTTSLTTTEQRVFSGRCTTFVVANDPDSLDVIRVRIPGLHAATGAEVPISPGDKEYFRNGFKGIEEVYVTSDGTATVHHGVVVG